MLAVGCQTYDFQPVTPVSLGQTTTEVSITAKQLKPNLMLVLDRSGSMHLPFDPTQPACGSCGQPGQPACDPATCPTRWDALTSTATDFLTQHGTVARMGVAFYPALSDATITDPGSNNTSNFCTPASAIDVGLPTSDDDSALRDGASAVDFAIKRVGATASPLAGGVGGGTPTGASLAFVAQHAGFGSTIQRQSFLLLMTDGLPNCNPAGERRLEREPGGVRLHRRLDLDRLHVLPGAGLQRLQRDGAEGLGHPGDRREDHRHRLRRRVRDLGPAGAPADLSRRGLPARRRGTRGGGQSVRPQPLPGQQPDSVLRAVLPGELEGAASAAGRGRSAILQGNPCLVARPSRWIQRSSPSW
jgi:hypothetical protein